MEILKLDKMKTIMRIYGSLLFVLLLMLSANVHAQDPMKAAPNVAKKVILENDKLRMIQAEFAPGETATWHSHPDHVEYALTDGKLEITDKGKQVRVVELKAGEALYMPAVTHMVKNIGTTTVKMVVFELKPAR
jgi:quercetin dioxygenase-like cupin family protein